MKTFDLELRVTTFGSVLAREIILEDVTDPGKVVRDWINTAEYSYKKLPQYQIADNALDVFVGCQGIAGGTVTCEVFINGSSAGTVLSKVENRFYSHGIFNV